MSWSTSALAGIAGTTVKTIRYCHHTGLLPEPPRASNGYKQYEVEHLVALLRVLRRRELGLSGKELGPTGDEERDDWAALDALDADLARRIERWTAVREELAPLLRSPRPGPPPVDLPAGMAGGASSTSAADRALLLVYSRLFDAETMAEITDSLRERTKSPAEVSFDALDPHADEPTRQHLAEGLAVVYAEAHGTTVAEGLRPPGLDQTAATAQTVLGETLASIYHDAQLDVLRRVGAMLSRGPSPDHPASAGE